MTQKKMIRTTLIACLFFLAFGGWLPHLRIHPLAKDAKNAIPLISGILSVFFFRFFFGSTLRLTQPILRTVFWLSSAL